MFRLAPVGTADRFVFRTANTVTRSVANAMSSDIKAKHVGSGAVNRCYGFYFCCMQIFNFVIGYCSVSFTPVDLKMSIGTFSGHSERRRSAGSMNDVDALAAR